MKKAKFILGTLLFTLSVTAVGCSNIKKEKKEPLGQDIVTKEMDRYCADMSSELSEANISLKKIDKIKVFRGKLIVANKNRTKLIESKDNVTVYYSISECNVHYTKLDTNSRKWLHTIFILHDDKTKQLENYRCFFLYDYYNSALMEFNNNVSYCNLTLQEKNSIINPVVMNSKCDQWLGTISHRMLSEF